MFRRKKLSYARTYLESSFMYVQQSFPSHQYQLHEVALCFHNPCSFADELTHHLPPAPNQSKNFRWFLLVVKNTQ